VNAPLLHDPGNDLARGRHALETERRALEQDRQAFEAERVAFRQDHQIALERSQQQLRTIFATEPDCVKIMTPDGELLEINPAGIAMFEAASLSELKAQPLGTLIRPEHRAAFGAMHAHVLAGQPGVLEFEIEGLRGTRRWLQTSATAMRDPLTAATVVLSISRDITQQKQAVKALVRNQTIVRHISNELPLGFLVVDERTDAVLHVNRRFCEIFHCVELLEPMRGGRITGREVMTRCTRLVLDGTAFAETGGEHNERDDRRVLESELRCSGDRTVRRLATPIRDEKDRYVGRFYLFEDVTTRRLADAERIRLEAQLHQAMKMQSIGRLAGGVAHDFNNMLGVIIGHAELAMREVKAIDPVHADLAAIHQAAERSAGLTRQLLAFASRQTAAPRQLDLNATVVGSLHLLRRLISEDIRLDWHPAPELWSVRIDPSQIDQILTNLCVNARDAIADCGTITIETANCLLDQDILGRSPDARLGEFVRLTVRDTGCGMDVAMVNQIFEPFFTTKRMGVGTGLGLATVYGTVRQNDGFITVDSRAGTGTSFEIYLPRVLAAPDESRADDVSPVTRSGRETVLVVEDEPAILRLISQILEARGYTVLRAGSPGEAHAIAQTHPRPIHLLLTDVIMPDMNGRDLAAKLAVVHPNMRSLFMSGYTSDVIAKHGVLEDGVSFIQKPFAIASLADKVREALDRE